MYTPITPDHTIAKQSTFATRTQEQQRQRWLGTREGARRNQRRPAAALGLDSDDMLPRFHILPRKHESAIRTRRLSELAGKTGEREHVWAVSGSPGVEFCAR